MMMTHALAELYGCLPAIEDAAKLAAAAKAAVEAVGATIVGEYEVRYVPHGLTVAVFLGESHIVLTTWPEYRLVLLDVMLCNPVMDYKAVVALVKEQICPGGRIVFHEVPRKVGAQP